MLRYVLTVAGAIAMISNVAYAEVGDMGGSTTKVITHSAEPGMASKKVIVKRHDDGLGASKKVVIKRHDDARYGALVTKKKIIRHDNMSGSSMGGGAVVEKHTIVR
jgi:hypothetical protein